MAFPAVLVDHRNAGAEAPERQAVVAPFTAGRRADRRASCESRLAACLVAITAAACSQENRPVGTDLPRTPPTSAVDPRIADYQKSAYQVSQGGRYYVWYGCGGCHAADGNAAGAGPDLGVGRRRHGDSFDAVYAAIAWRHPGVTPYAERIPVEQLWQITAYVRELPGLDPAKRRRQDLDTAAEPPSGRGPAPRPTP